MVNRKHINKVSTITYEGKEYPIIYVDGVEKEKLEGVHNLACTTDNGMIVVFDAFYKLSDESKQVVLMSELAHILGYKSEDQADLFAIKQIGFLNFKRTIEEIKSVLYTLYPEKDEEIKNYIYCKMNDLRVISAK
jgi:hypothetical protein